MTKNESQEHPFVPLHQQRSPSADKEEQHKKQIEFEKKLRQDFAFAFNSASGRNVLRWIKDQCGYGKSVVGGNPSLGMDIEKGTLYNAARLGVYLELRVLIPSEILKQVEFEKLEEPIS